jgi:hypothetical protein
MEVNTAAADYTIPSSFFAGTSQRSQALITT